MMEAGDGRSLLYCGGIIRDVNFGWFLQSGIDEGQAQRVRRRSKRFIGSIQIGEARKLRHWTALFIKLDMGSQAGGSHQATLTRKLILGNVAAKILCPAGERFGLNV